MKVKGLKFFSLTLTLSHQNTREENSHSPDAKRNRRSSTTGNIQISSINQIHVVDTSKILSKTYLHFLFVYPVVLINILIAWLSPKFITINCLSQTENSFPFWNVGNFLTHLARFHSIFPLIKRCVSLFHFIASRRNSFYLRVQCSNKNSTLLFEYFVCVFLFYFVFLILIYALDSNSVNKVGNKRKKSIKECFL